MTETTTSKKSKGSPIVGIVVIVLLGLNIYSIHIYGDTAVSWFGFVMISLIGIIILYAILQLLALKILKDEAPLSKYGKPAVSSLVGYILLFSYLPFLMNSLIDGEAVHDTVEIDEVWEETISQRGSSVETSSYEHYFEYDGVDFQKSNGHSTYNTVRLEGSKGLFGWVHFDEMALINE